jgi:hypothetical protein
MSAISESSTDQRFDGSGGPRKIGPADGKLVDIQSAGVRFMAWSEETGYVLEGRMGARLGDDVVYAEAGDLVFKPRNQWHTFWNAGDWPCRILEIISPGGFEHCFDEVAAAMASPDFDPQQMAEGAARYGLELQPESVPALCAEHGLTHPMLQASH